MNNIEEFFYEFRQDILVKAGSENDFTEEKFTEIMCDFLVEQAVVENYDSAFFKKDHQGIRVDAWNLNKEKQELCLFIADFNPTSALKSLTQTDVDKWFRRAEKFFVKAVSATFYRDLEESLPIYAVAQDISENANNISKVKILLLSNSALSSRVIELKDTESGKYTISYDIWDISRLARIKESGKAKEDIIIDFSMFDKNGIQCLPAYTESSICKSYLLVISGEILADLYDKYGERLLEQNVRTFLQFRGNVNKGIRNTLKNQPEMFFAYNNGLTVTAEDVVFKDNSLMSVKNLQIVNGGQTTASIFMAKRLDKKEINLEKVYIQVKLTVIDSDKVDDVVPKISKCANTQNKVSAADFFSNHPFHKRIEDFSRRLLAPSKTGGLIETYWFYERARGQYANRQIKLTPTQKKQFLIQNPKNQMFTKTDLAKYQNSFNQFPHYVSKGAQWNFGKFAEEISGKGDSNGLWDKNDLQYNEVYFKQLIAKAIIFKSLDRQVAKQAWYGGYKANIVTYTLAKFAYVVQNIGQHIDYMSIWNKQQMDNTLNEQLLDLAKVVNDFITDTDLNVTQYCKQEICWQKIKKINYSLFPEIEKSLLDKETILDIKKNAKHTQKILNDIEAQTAVYNKGVDYWASLLDWGDTNKVLTERDMGILNATIRMNKRFPSEKQCQEALTIEQRVIEEGFFINE